MRPLHVNPVATSPKFSVDVSFFVWVGFGSYLGILVAKGVGRGLSWLQGAGPDTRMGNVITSSGCSRKVVTSVASSDDSKSSQ